MTNVCHLHSGHHGAAAPLLQVRPRLEPQPAGDGGGSRPGDQLRQGGGRAR